GEAVGEHGRTLRRVLDPRAGEGRQRRDRAGGAEVGMHQCRQRRLLLQESAREDYVTKRSRRAQAGDGADQRLAEVGKGLGAVVLRDDATREQVALGQRREEIRDLAVPAAGAAPADRAARAAAAVDDTAL